jgi:hypothetical protein
MKMSGKSPLGSPHPSAAIMTTKANWPHWGAAIPGWLPKFTRSAVKNETNTYLVRMKAKGLNPFKDQPRRTDLHYTEAVGHFHLYAWLQAAIGRRCVTSPEFPTGNGKVDIHIRCNGNKGIIEVKSFVDMSETRKGTEQAAAYARSLNLNSVTLALFVPVDDETVLAKLSGEHQNSGVTVTVVAIGWT